MTTTTLISPAQQAEAVREREALALAAWEAESAAAQKAVATLHRRHERREEMLAAIRCGPECAAALAREREVEMAERELEMVALEQWEREMEAVKREMAVLARGAKRRRLREEERKVREGKRAKRAKCQQVVGCDGVGDCCCQEQGLAGPSSRRR